MSIEAFRLIRPTYVDTALTGEGARRYGGRFNSPGRSVIYASSALSLAVLEVLVHAAQPRDLSDYVGIRLAFDAELARNVGALPWGWRDNSWPEAVQHIGDRWLDERRSAALRVPSAVIPSEDNYVIDPGHPDFEQIRHEVVEVDIDNRIYRIGGGMH